jgi:chromosome segregation ATPase
MEMGTFESLAQKVESAVARIDSLKRERDELQTQLHAALEHSGHLERELAGRQEDVDTLRRDIESRDGNIHEADERLKGMVARLEEALA